MLISGRDFLTGSDMSPLKDPLSAARSLGRQPRCTRKLARPEPASELAGSTSLWVLLEFLPCLPPVMDGDLKVEALSSPSCFWSECLITETEKQTTSDLALISDTKQI